MDQTSEMTLDQKIQLNYKNIANIQQKTKTMQQECDTLGKRVDKIKDPTYQTTVKRKINDVQS